jgi:hypothetical protein
VRPSPFFAVWLVETQPTRDILIGYYVRALVRGEQHIRLTAVTGLLAYHIADILYLDNPFLRKTPE